MCVRARLQWLGLLQHISTAFEPGPGEEDSASACVKRQRVIEQLKQPPPDASPEVRVELGALAATLEALALTGSSSPRPEGCAVGHADAQSRVFLTLERLRESQSAAAAPFFTGRLSRRKAFALSAEGVSACRGGASSVEGRGLTR